MIAIIAAISKNGVIGNNGHIPWKIRGEQQRFKELTIGNIVIMGRKTFEEIGKPLPNRMNIVISKTKVFSGENLYTVDSLQKALNFEGNRDVFIAGGTRLYQEALPIVDKLYLTEINKEYDGDAYFPEFNQEDFLKTIDKVFVGEIPYSYVIYTRKQ